MARGWESKSVESQVADREIAERSAKLERDEAVRDEKRHTLEMSRRRIVRELETATSHVHRVALENALKFLDDELKRLAAE